MFALEILNFPLRNILLLSVCLLTGLVPRASLWSFAAEIRAVQQADETLRVNEAKCEHVRTCYVVSSVIAHSYACYQHL